MMHHDVSLAECPATLPGAIRSAHPRARTTPSRSSGMLVGRPDLGNDEILSAIADRLRFERRDPGLAAGVLKAALDGRPAALSLMRRLVLPAPRVPLSMPIQAILREPAAKKPQGSAPWFKFVSFGR